MMALSGRTGAWLLPLVAALWLAGCGSRPVNRAPVEDRGTGVSAPAPMAVDPATAAQRAPPGIENAGKPGYYTVKPGDTLIRIGLETGQNWKDVARWNGLDNPNLIEVGQVLRVIAPAAAPVVGSAVVTRPVVPASVTSSAVAPGSTASPAAPVVVATAPPAAPAPALSGDDDVSWMWPAQGSVLAGFDEAKNKGLDIGGTAGDAVLAAADGRVVYVGASLRGYGNLIILKHNNTFLTAYAHNQVLLVKEDQTVRKGQRIAEMGSSDADRVKLHFEVRRQGKPVDPAKYLPAR
jgi:lipoprotein NlpD